DQDGRVLVNKEGTSDTWSLPGGGWGHGETEHQALARELEEEVNYKGEFTTTPFKTAVFWLESKQAWLLWIVYDVNPERLDFSAGKHSTEITFVHPSSLIHATSFEEQSIFSNLT